MPALDPEAAREHAEQLAGYLDAIKDIAARREEIRDLPRAMWERLFNVGLPIGIDNATVSVISELGLECLEEAFAIIAQHAEMGAHMAQSSTVARARTRYFFGIVKRRRETVQRQASTSLAPTQDASSSRVIRAVLRAVAGEELSREHLEFLWQLIAMQEADGWIFLGPESDFDPTDPMLRSYLETLEDVGLIHWYQRDLLPRAIELPVEFRFDLSSNGWSVGPNGYPTAANPKGEGL